MGSVTQGEKAALVKELREEGYSLKYLLVAMGLSKSTYYYEIGKTDKVQERNADISLEIENIFKENKGRYGARRVYQELVRRGFLVNHKRVQSIMNRLGLVGKRPKEKYHSYRGEVGKVAANIINRDFSTDRPLQKWTTDVSQFTLPWGKCYQKEEMSLRTSPLSWCGNPPDFRTITSENLGLYSYPGDCHTSDVGHWFAMTSSFGLF